MILTEHYMRDVVVIKWHGLLQPLCQCGNLSGAQFIHFLTDFDKRIMFVSIHVKVCSCKLERFFHINDIPTNACK